MAAEVAALLAYTAIRSNDRVGLIIFSDQVEHYIPPKKGRGHVWRVIRDILTHRPQRSGTDLDGALDYLGRVARRRVVAFLISDFLDQGWPDRLRIAGRRHDLGAEGPLVSIPGSGDVAELSVPAGGLAVAPPADVVVAADETVTAAVSELQARADSTKS